MLLLTLTVLAAGCSGARGVPGGADLVTEATVKSSFQSPADGMLYVFRSPRRGTRGQLHYSGPILAGQVVVIDPAMNRITLDGEPLEVLLPGGDVLYQAYFRRDSSVRRAISGARTVGAVGGRDFDRESTRDATTRGSMMRDQADRETSRDASRAAEGATGTE